MAECSRRPDRSSGNHVRQTWCVFSAVCSQPCHTIWVCTCSRMKRSWRHSYSDIVQPDQYECSASEDITCTCSHGPVNSWPCQTVTSWQGRDYTCCCVHNTSERLNGWSWKTRQKWVTIVKSIYNYNGTPIGNCSDLSNFDIFNNLEWPYPGLQGLAIFQRQVTRKRYKIDLYLQWWINTKGSG